MNDCTPDNTLKLLKNFEEKDERIQIIIQDNLGTGIVRNVGMKASKGEYIIFLD